MGPMDKVLCIFWTAVTVFEVSKMFTVSCMETSSSLSCVFHIAIQTSQLIDATFVKFIRSDGGVIGFVLGQKFFCSVVSLVCNVYVGVSK